MLFPKNKILRKTNPFIEDLSQKFLSGEKSEGVVAYISKMTPFPVKFISDQDCVEGGSGDDMKFMRKYSFKISFRETF